MRVRENVPIPDLTTMRVGGDARYVVDIATTHDMIAAYALAHREELPTFILGGGANTLGLDEGFPGVVLHNKIRGISIVNQVGNNLTVKAMGGEPWDRVVEFVCKRGYTGVEALSMIPGTVGAAPVQNIGAYGQEVAEVVVEVEAYDTRERKMTTIGAADCGFGYRKSIFNSGPDRGRYFIVSVTMCVQRGQMQPPFYNSLQRYLDEHEITDYTPMTIREAVMAIRADKLPDPAVIASAGSFFKNVYLTDAEADAAEAAGVPVWRVENGNKVNSGWLIDQCGLRGAELHGMRISEKAALVLINERTRKYSDVAAARDEIKAAVREKFGYEIEQEPVEMRA